MDFDPGNHALSAAAPALVAKGCVNVVRLDGIRTRAGRRWQRIKEAAYIRLEALFKAHLGPSDFFARIDEDSYLVTLPGREPDDVNLVCLRVSYELHKDFLGECEASSIDIFIATAAEGNGLELVRVGVDKIMRLAKSIGIDDIALPLSASAAVTDDGADWGEIGRGAGLGDDLPDPDSEGEIAVEFHFQPSWFTRRSVVLGSHVEIKALTLNGRPVHFKELTIIERARVEARGIAAAAAAMQECLDLGQRMLIIVPLSFEVLTTPAARRIALGACRRLSRDQRNHIAVLITALPPGVPHMRLCDLANFVKPYFRSVSVTVPPGTINYDVYQGAGLRTIGFDLREYAASPILADEILRLSRHADRLGMVSFLSHVDRPAVLETARVSEIASLVGRAVLPPRPKPCPMWRLTWEDVLGQPLVEI